MKGSLSNYEIGEIIGQNDFTTVYKSEIKETHQIVAIKSLYFNDDKSDEFISYLSKIKILENDKLIHIYNYFSEKRKVYIVSEYCLGTLLEFIQQRTLSEIEISAISRKILEILDFFASNEFISNDIRPENIFLSPDYKIKVSPISTRSMHEKILQIDMSYDRENYFAPEILGPFGPVSPLSDIWSLGIVVIELFTGKAPYSNIKKMRNRLISIAKDDPPKPPKNSSPEFQSFVSKCLKKKSSERSSAKMLLNDSFITSLSEKDGDEIIHNLIEEFKTFEFDEYEEEEEEEEEANE